MIFKYKIIGKDNYFFETKKNYAKNFFQVVLFSKSDRFVHRTLAHLRAALSAELLPPLRQIAGCMPYIVINIHIFNILRIVVKIY